MVNVGTLVTALIQTLATPAPTLLPGEALLQVSASGEAEGVPDVAELSTGVTSDGATAQAAPDANARVARRLVDTVRAQGVAAADIKTSQLAVRPRYRPDKEGDDTDEIVGYRTTNQLTVRVRSVALAPRIVDALVSAGATTLDGPRFSFAHPEVMTAQARRDAVDRARRQAGDYAGAIGMTLGRVLRVSERALDNAENGSDIIVTGSRVATAIQPGTQKVRVSVWIDYALAPTQR